MNVFFIKTKFFFFNNSPLSLKHFHKSFTELRDNDRKKHLFSQINSIFFLNNLVNERFCMVNVIISFVIKITSL